MKLATLACIVLMPTALLAQNIVGNPTASQRIAQPANSSFSVNQFESIVFADQASGADIAAKINNACRFLPSTGGKIVLPAGTFNVTSSNPNPIYLNQGSGCNQLTTATIILEGAGIGATIISCPNVTGCITVGSNVQVRDLTLSGATGSAAGVGINSGSAINVVIERVEIKNFALGIDTGANGNAWKILDNYIHDNTGCTQTCTTAGGDGIFLASGTGSTIIKGNHVYNNGSNGIDLNSPWNVVTGNSIFNNGINSVNGIQDRSGIFVQAIGANSDHNTITGNTVYNHPAGGITIRGITGFSTSYSIVTGNNLCCNSWGIDINDAGVNGLMAGNKVVGNIIQNSTSYNLGGLSCLTTTGTISNTLFADNTIVGSYGYGILVSGSGCTDTQVKDNTSLSNSVANIYDSGVRTTMAGNKTETFNAIYQIGGDLDVAGTPAAATKPF